MVRLWLEFVLLYVVLPASLLAVRAVGGSFPVLPVLWVAALPAALYLVKRRGWGRRELLGIALTPNQWLHMGLRVAAAAAVLTAGLLVVAPGQLFELPLRKPALWALVLVFYPLLSVYAQGLLYRGLFYARYAALFGSERGAWLAGSVAFSLAHLAFANPWALALTFVGGLFINRTYRKSGSMLASDLEHAAYGQLVFTIGWGRFLYHGTVRLLESCAS